MSWRKHGRSQWKRQSHRHDEDVVPFVVFWDFGRRDGQWMLKDPLPPATGKFQMKLENMAQRLQPRGFA